MTETKECIEYSVKQYSGLIAKIESLIQIIKDQEERIRELEE